jgi:hypothetical protein
MPTINLQNITIKQLTDKNSNTYYLIVNNENQDEAYFCFSGTINQETWQELEDNYEIIKEVEIEYSEKESGLKTYRKVINLQIKEQAELF